MKVTVLAENLQKKLPFVTRAVSLKSQLPILLHILLEARSGKLICSATDLEIGIQVEIPANVEEEGATTVTAKTFVELINSLPPEKIKLETKENSILVTTPKTKSVIQTQPSEEFPKLYEHKGEKIITIKKILVHKDLPRVVFAASTDTGRPALSGVLLKKDTKGMLTVATDGYRLSLKHHLATVKSEENEKKVLIPARVLREVIGVKEDEGGLDVFISKESNQVLFEQGATIIVGRLIDAEFPSYDKIIPTNFSTRCAFDREEMQKAVKICAIFAREAANIVKLSIIKSGITVSANTPSVGENTVEVEATVSGEENEIAFNARYLLDLLSSIEESDLVLEMSGSLNPGVFKIKDDPSFLHLIMPIRVQTEQE